MKHMKLSQKNIARGRDRSGASGPWITITRPRVDSYARVRGYVGVQVKRGRHCVHVAPLDIQEIAIVHVLDTSSISGLLSMVWSQPRSHYYQTHI